MPDRDARLTRPEGALPPESDAGERSRGAGSGFNRRDFMKGSGAAIAATAAATAVVNETEAQAAQEAGAVVPAKAVEVKLNVNGQEHVVKVEPRVTLLDALRHDLNLTGAKSVCDTTNCGGCTVIIDGKPVYSCSRLAVECAGKKVTTVEGLTGGKNIEQVVAAFVKHDASQCGYCTPGFVVAVKSFLDTNPKANIEEVLKGLGGNLCRCGTYVGVAGAALECAGLGKGA